MAWLSLLQYYGEMFTACNVSLIVGCIVPSILQGLHNLWMVYSYSPVTLPSQHLHCKAVSGFLCICWEATMPVKGWVCFTLAEAYKEPGNTTKAEELREYLQNIGEMKTASGALRFPNLTNLFKCLL